MQILNAQEQDLSFIRALLIDEALPAGDIDEAELWIVREEKPIGCFGFQFFGADALFRSMAVVSSHRGEGLGGKMLQAALDIAQKRGVERVWLLTDRAEAYYWKRGFEKVERRSAPAALQGTDQFSSFCGPNAVCMVKAVSF